MEGTYPSASGELTVRLPDPQSFEALRVALDDPLWLVGATWEILTTNEFKRGRFDDAFGAFVSRQDGHTLARRLTDAGVDATCTQGDPSGD